MSDAVRIGQIITARCSCCGRVRHCHPEDWMRLLGDVPCYLQQMAFGGKVAKQTLGVDPRGSASLNLDRLAPLLEKVHEAFAGFAFDEADLLYSISGGKGTPARELIVSGP